MLETCRGGPGPIRSCVEKTKNFGQIQPQQTWRPKWTEILIKLQGLAGEALGLLGCVLKRLKI